MKGLAPKLTNPRGLPRAGEIRSNTIPYLVYELSAARLDGILAFTYHEIRKTIQLGHGSILFATSNDRDDRLNQILLKADVLPLKSLLKALELALATKDRLGEVMVRLKMMAMPDVEKWVKIQVEQIVHGIFNWTRGQYAFEEKKATGESITLGTPGNVVVLEGVRRISSWARVYEEVGGMNTEYRTTKDMPAIVRGLPILPEETALLELCDSPMSLGELCEAYALIDYDVCKAVWALLVIGALMKS